MNYLEDMVKTCDKRLKKIAENPDPILLRSNKVFYEAERGACIERIEAWKQGKPFVIAPGEIWGVLQALGFYCMDSWRSSMRRTNDADELFDALRAAGLPDEACDITSIPLIMHIRGELPLPAFVVVNTSVCEPIISSMHALASMYEIPSFCLDVKLEPTYDAIRYCAEQLGELIEYAESKVPGLKYNEDKLLELHEIDQQAIDCLRDIYEARKAVPCPIAGKDTFRNPPLPGRFPNPYKWLEWYQAFRDEVVERAEKGIGAVAEEKLRFLWTVTGPYYANPFAYLEKRGVTVPMYSAAGTGRRVLVSRWGTYGDEKEFGRKLTPLEEQARMTFSSWGGLGSIWVDDTICMCKDLKIDGIVNFLQGGCPTMLGMLKPLSDRVEAELGIPTLQMEGRNIDPSSYDQRQFEAKLGGFIDLCLSRKRMPTA